MIDSKPSNPKDLIGSGKLPLDLAPDTIKAEVALAHLEGALKYGGYNWRIAGVRASIYKSAAERHLMKWWNGENADPKTRVKHLASVIACAGILLDAELCGKLTDDRPPTAPLGDLIDGHEETVKHLKEMFKDYDPRHYTIADSVPLPDSGSGLAVEEKTCAAGGSNGAREERPSDNSVRPDSGDENPGAMPGSGKGELDPRVLEVLNSYRIYWGANDRGSDADFYRYSGLFLRLTPEQKDQFRAVVAAMGLPYSR